MPGSRREVQVLAEDSHRESRRPQVFGKCRARRELCFIDVHALLRMAVAVSVPSICRGKDQIIKKLARQDL